MHVRLHNSIRSLVREIARRTIIAPGLLKTCLPWERSLQCNDLEVLNRAWGPSKLARHEQGFADVLRAYGANLEDVRPMDELVGACRREDAKGARNIMDLHPEVLKTVRPEDYEVLVEAAAKNRLDQVILMTDVGFDPGGFGESG